MSFRTSCCHRRRATWSMTTKLGVIKARKFRRLRLSAKSHANTTCVCRFYVVSCRSTVFLPQIRVSDVEGTGKDGRVLKEDIVRHVAQLKANVEEKILHSTKPDSESKPPGGNNPTKTFGAYTLQLKTFTTQTQVVLQRRFHRGLRLLHLNRPLIVRRCLLWLKIASYRLSAFDEQWQNQ